MQIRDALDTSSRAVSRDRAAALLRPAVRYGYVPFMLLGVNGVALALVTGGASHWTLGVLLVGAVALSLAAERVLPYAPAWNRDRGDSARDLAHAVVNESLVFGSIIALPALLSRLPSVPVWPSDWPLVLQVLVAIVAADLGITLAHLASHRIEPLWRLHAVHHSVQRFYGFNGLLKHPLHLAVEMAAGVLPLVLLGLPVDVATVLAFCVATQLLLQHSNVDYRVGVLRRWLALNEGHRFHHLKWPGVGDVNFGLFTLVWDRLFGTFCFDSSRRFTSDDLGIAKWPDYPRGYLAQLVEPFRSH